MPRSVSVRLEADVASYVASMRKASAASADLGKRIGATSKEVDAALRAQANAASRAEAATRQQAAEAARAAQQQAAAAKQAAAAQEAAAARTRATLGSLGTSVTRAGLVGVAGLGLLGKAAVDWESDWAGVTKTVNGTQPQLDALEGSLRQMAKTLPASHQDIAAVAEAAGQLGVATPDIAGFTKVMVELGTTTNLTSDEAATSLAQFMNVLNTAPDKVSNLGSALVYLGNNGASTEKQILDLGTRAAAAGGQIGLSEADVLGFASAITSTGMNVEAGGTAISKVFTKINTATKQGGDNLDGIAKVAGMTGAQFKQAFATDSAGAIDTFVEGLGEIKASGGDVSQTLRDVGIKGAYEVDTLGRLAGASKAAGRETGLLTENLRNGEKGFEQNTALAKEAATRYQTTASQIQIAWNKIKDAGITAGGALLPIIAQVAGGAGKLATAFAGLPDSAKRGAVGVGLVTSAALLVGGGTLKAIVAVGNLRKAMKDLAVDSPRAASAMASIGKAGVAVGVILAMTAAFVQLSKATNGTVSANLEDVTKTLLDLANGPGVNLDEKFQFADTSGLALKGITGVNDALTRLGDNGFRDALSSKFDSVTGLTDSAETKARDLFATYDKGFMALNNAGQTEAAGKAFAQLAAQVKAGGGSLKALTEQFPQYAASVTSAAAANGNVVTSTDQLVTLMSGGLPAGFKGAATAADGTKTAIGAVGDASDEAATQLKTLTDALNEQASAALAASGSNRGVQAAINAANRAGKDYVDAMVAKADADGKSTSAAKKTAEAALASGKAFKGTSDESLALGEALDGVASASLTNIQAMRDNGSSAAAVSKANEKARGAFLDVARGMGVSKKAAREMADEYFGVGKINVKPKITAPSDAALKKANLTRAAFEALPKDTKAKITALFNNGKAKEAQTLLGTIGRYTAKPKINVTTNAAQTAAAARREMNVPNTSATITVSRRMIAVPGSTGGLATPGGFIHRSNGGPVWGAGTATSDSIDAKLSNGEFVIRAAAVKAIGQARLMELNAAGAYARGGPVGFAGGGLAGVPSNVNVSTLKALIAAIASPLRDLSRLTAAVARAQVTARAATAAARAPKAAADAATRRYNAARDAKAALSLDNAREVSAARRRVAEARADLNHGKATKAERAALARAEAAASKVSRDNTKQNAEAAARVTAATKAKTAATDRYNKVAEKSKAASDALKTAQQALADQQQAVADTARSASENLQGQFTTPTTDARDWLATLKQGALDVAAFGAKIRRLRSAGLNEALIQQIAGLGVGAGTELATQITSGGGALIAALNAAAKNLKSQSDLLGLLLATPGSHAAGGPISGPGTGTSDSIPARLSNGEYVVNARATAANRGVLDAMNYGRAVITHNHVQGYAGGGYATLPAAQIDVAALALAVRSGMAGLHMQATVNGDTVGMVVQRALGGFVGAFGRGNA